MFVLPPAWPAFDLETIKGFFFFFLLTRFWTTLFKMTATVFLNSASFVPYKNDIFSSGVPILRSYFTKQVKIFSRCHFESLCAIFGAWACVEIKMLLTGKFILLYATDKQRLRSHATAKVRLKGGAKALCSSSTPSAAVLQCFIAVCETV